MKISTGTLVEPAHAGAAFRQWREQGRGLAGIVLRRRKQRSAQRLVSPTHGEGAAALQTAGRVADIEAGTGNVAVNH